MPGGWGLVSSGYRKLGVGVKHRVTKTFGGTFVGICGSKGRLICLISVSYRYYSVEPIATT